MIAPRDETEKRGKKPLWPYVLLTVVGLLVTAFVAFGVFVLWALHDMSSGTTLKDFATDAEAVAFVSDHLTVPLPPGAKVTALRYDRFTDWHLTAKVTLPSPGTYLEAVRANHGPQGPSHCSAISSATEVSYYLAKWQACGTVLLTAPDTVEVTCGTT